MGEPFQSPFATPPGKGHSSSAVNVLWGAFNLSVGYGLLVQVGEFDLHNLLHVAIAATGSFVFALITARNFGKYNGGNLAK